MDTPVALIIFNRPEKTRRVVKEIAKAKPRKLFVIADGPRKDHSLDTQKCRDARSVIDDNINWECEVVKNYANENLGCAQRPATGISWVFDHVDRAIILEDDCLPHPTFFQFCDELLEKYIDNPRLMQINGINLDFKKERSGDSYCFSSSNHCWGWATWRRAWDHYDINITKWPDLKSGTWLFDILNDQQVVRFWERIFDEAYEGAGKVSYWDFQWRFALWSNNGLAISPSESLVTNIGFDEEGTHTRNKNHLFAQIKTTQMKFPLRHPVQIKNNLLADQLLEQSVIKNMSAPLTRPALHQRIKRKLKKLVRFK